MNAEYDKTWGRENSASLNMSYLVTALSHTHAWILEIQKQLKEQEDAIV